MSSDNKRHVVNNPWETLRQFTDARIGLGRAGISLPTHQMLKFQLEHAQARDAVHFPLDFSELESQLKTLSQCPTYPVMQLKSRAEDRVIYLQRPDFGRRLNEQAREQLTQFQHANNEQVSSAFDLAIVVVDGLSSLAVQKNIAPFLTELLPGLTSHSNPWSLAPITLIEQGRVAIGDEVGELLNAAMVLVLIGERPGLSSPDSLGAYLTFNPKVGLTDASRNCISNIRPAGLSYREAARRALYLMNEARHLKLSGVNLKDRTEDEVVSTIGSSKNFLIS
ncbi:MAG: ethanolamine ammonia-lyase subunit EutC [Oleibacter sp.]|nr:ethanolamine ammonia-lyase subunit EutC [Thalassolituus sp.]